MAMRNVRSGGTLENNPALPKSLYPFKRDSKVIIGLGQCPKRRQPIEMRLATDRYKNHVRVLTSN
jgi:hypothetical protein